MRAFKIILLAVLAASGWDAYAQKNRVDSYSSFSDFHIHPTFKNYYRYVENPDSLNRHQSDRQLLNKKYGQKAWQPFVRKSKAKRKGKESHMGNYNQSDYTNLKSLDSSVLCMSITPPEKIMLSSKADRWISNHLVTHMSIPRQEVLANQRNSSFNEFLGEYNFVISQDSIRDGTKILLAKNNADLRRIVSEGGIGMVTTIEGGHVLFGSEALGSIESIKSKDCDVACRAEILANIERLHQLPHNVFFITVAHFGWNKMFGNSKSLDKPGLRRNLLTAASMSDNFKANMFAKYGDGIIGDVRSAQLMDTTIESNGRSINITLPYSKDQYRTDIGYEVMYKLLDAENDFKHPIYLDAKHMDIKARFQYYEFIDSVNTKRRAAGKKTIPIIASHIGLSGKKRQVAIATAQFPLSNSYEELIFGRTFYQVQMNDHDLYWRNYTRLLKPQDRSIYFAKGTAPGTTGFNPFEGNINENTLGWFYPWEINFCDDEIKYIYESDGILGLNMDSRILGYNMPNYSWRYKKYLKHKFKDLNRYKLYTLEDGTVIKFEEYFLAEPLLRNIFRVVEVSGRDNASAWNHLAIGSDFDGFIQPITLCPTTESIPSFHKKMVAFTKIFVDIHNQEKLMYGLSPETVMRKFFYANGRDFIFRNFQE